MILFKKTYMSDDVLELKILNQYFLRWKNIDIYEDPVHTK